MKIYVHLWYYLAIFFLEWEMFHTKVLQNITKYILCSLNFPPPQKKILPFMMRYDTIRYLLTATEFLPGGSG